VSREERTREVTTLRALRRRGGLSYHPVVATGLSVTPQDNPRPDPSAPVRVAVLGCGKLATEVLLPILTHLAEVEVSVIADVDEGARARANALAPAAAPVTDWRDAIAADVHAAIVALPTAMHAEAARMAIELKRHIYLEKPIAATVEQGHAVLEAYRNAPRPAPAAMVGFNYRFNPLVAELTRRIRDGEIGAPKAIRTVFSTKATPGATWRRPDAQGGGVLLDLGSHHVDLMRCLTGDEIASVSAQRTMSSDGAEHVAATIQMARGAVVHSVFATGTGDEDRIEMEGERGRLAIDRYRSWVVHRHAARSPAPFGKLRELAGWRYAIEKQRAPWHEPSFARALAAFVATARGAAAQGASLDDGLKSLLAIDAAERSCRDGGAVAVASA
jgi:myo-inositol 2-dehydrogenase/D-chiro-inositol 1-dehydrogenase